MRYFGVLVLIFALAASGGCTLGPQALRVSSGQYNRAIQRAADEQLLLNLVRLKYRDSPLFLEIGNVAAQFTFGAEASGVGKIREGGAQGLLDLGAKLTFQDRPTITYTPLQGEDFVSRLMAPLDIETLIMLYHSGWSIERIFRLSVQRLGGLENAPSAAGPTPGAAPEYEDFARAVRELRRLQSEGLLSLGYRSAPKRLSSAIASDRVTGGDLVAAADKGYTFEPEGPASYVLMGSTRNPIVRVDPEAFERIESTEALGLLGLGREQSIYPLSSGVAGGGAGSAGSLTIQTRSLMGVLFYLSQSVQVPDNHLARGLTTITRMEDGSEFDWQEVTKNLLSIRVSKSAPYYSAVAIRYRDHWYYIAENDLDSKSTFTLLGQLFSLQSGDKKSVAPVLTLSIGN